MAPAMRSGARMGDTQMIDMMVAVLTDPFGVGHMGITAENLATKWNITREEQDAFAVESQRRAAAAIADGRFKSQIVPITLKSRKGDTVFDTDEHGKPNTTMESLAKMRPAFKKDGTVTAGNASGMRVRPSLFWLPLTSHPRQGKSQLRAWFLMPSPECRTRLWVKALFLPQSWLLKKRV